MFAFDEILDVRGAGLLLGIQTRSNNSKISKLFEDQGLLTIPAADNVIRITPPLIVDKEDVDAAIKKIRKVLKTVN